uniref:Uncharacterized protein n=1 Tax=Manihot esculenta TaxID=3983 RepID=A0A2C9UM18_MANES
MDLWKTRLSWRTELPVHLLLVVPLCNKDPYKDSGSDLWI